MDPLEILSLIGDEENPPTDDELREARSDFQEQLRSAVAAKEITEGKSLRQAISLITDELDSRAKAAADEDAEAQALLEGMEDPEAAEETEEEPETEEAEEVEESEEVDALEALRIASRNARARIDSDAVPENPANVRVVGVGNAAIESLDHSSTVDDVAKMFAQYARGTNRGRETLVRMLWDLPEDRTLDADTGRSYHIIESVLGNNATSFEAVAAAGGICGPLDTVFEIPLIGSRGRPIRDALTRFGADRGGVRYIAAPRPSQGTVDDGVAVWTNANDTSPSSPSEKPCPHIDCDDECTQTVDAITACLVVGNFQAKFSPEEWANALGQLGIRHDRIAEQKLLSDIDAGSIDATFAPGSGGTITGVLGAVDRAVAAIRSRERLSEATGFRLILDGWLRPALRSQFTAQAPAGQTAAPGVADAQIAQWFANRGVTVTYTADDTIFGAQADGALNDFPSETTLRVFPEGTWWFLDGGTLDLGTEIVDADLIAQNDRQAFMETFETAAKRTAPCDEEGDDSLSITVDVDEACLDACVTSP